jgi:hypothetical protein
MNIDGSKRHNDLQCPSRRSKPGLAKMVEHGAANCFIDTAPSVSEQKYGAALR